MGLLDDAIREHLELKRKHGADPEDVARQEQEALGPGQRNEFAQPEAPEEPAAERRPPSAEPRSRDAAPPLSDGAARGASRRPRRRAAEAAGYEEDPWLDEEPDEVPADEALEQRRRAAAGEGGRAGGDAGLPPGDARSTTASGSSRSRRATSTGTSRPTQSKRGLRR